MSIIQKQIITNIENRDAFLNLLTINPGLILIKLGATWCGPCKRIKPVIDAFYASSPPNVMCCEIDVDECFDLYSFLKTKRITNGVPVILCYRQGNITAYPDDSITGADPNDLDLFFKRCAVHLMVLQKLQQKQSQKK